MLRFHEHLKKKKKKRSSIKGVGCTSNVQLLFLGSIADQQLECTGLKSTQTVRLKMKIWINIQLLYAIHIFKININCRRKKKQTNEISPVWNWNISKF